MTEWTHKPTLSIHALQWVLVVMSAVLTVAICDLRRYEVSQMERIEKACDCMQATTHSPQHIEQNVRVESRWDEELRQRAATSPYLRKVWGMDQP